MAFSNWKNIQLLSLGCPSALIHQWNGEKTQAKQKNGYLVHALVFKVNVLATLENTN